MMIWDLKKKDHQLLCQDQDVSMPHVVAEMFLKCRRQLKLDLSKEKKVLLFVNNSCLWMSYIKPVKLTGSNDNNTNMTYI